ncbi:MAG TPA: acyl carrier protein [Candidatus Acidoferrales bacterium]
MKSVEERIIQVISISVMDDASQVRPETKLSELGMDSLEQIECVLSLEDTFKVELNEALLWKLRTVQDVVNAVNQALAKAS